MDHDLSPKLARLRHKVFELMAEARSSFEAAMRPENPNVFDWHGQRFWVDRVRHLILSIFSVDFSAQEGSIDLSRQDSLPISNQEAFDTLDVYGGERQLQSARSFQHVLLELLREGSIERLAIASDPARLLTLAVGQASINPAFGPLFWLAFAEDVGLHDDPSANFFDLIETMIYAQMHYPERVPAAIDVRRAQIAFLERVFPGSTDPACEAFSDQDWAACCEDQLQAHLDFLDQRIFYSLWACGALSSTKR